MCGAALGIAAARWATGFLLHEIATDAVPVLDVAVHVDVLLFAILTTGASAMLFGIVPAFRASRVTPIEAVKHQAGGETRRIGRTGIIVVAQVATSVALVVATSLFVRTFVLLTSKPLGFDAGRVLVSRVDLTRVAPNPLLRARVFDQLAETARGVAGVRAVSTSLATPLSGGLSTRMVDEPHIGGREADRIVSVNFVGPGWFAMYGTPLLRGRDVDQRDTADTQPVAIVNEAFVRKFFAPRDPVGQRIVAPAPVTRGVPISRTIIGVAGDAVYYSLREPVQPTLYIPLTQWDFALPFSGGSISIRSDSRAADVLTRALSDAMTKTSPDVTFDFRVLTQQIRWAATQERVLAMLAGFFGVVALLLGGLGLYGVTSQVVLGRRREIGIRIALGGPPILVVPAILARVAGLVALGMIVGVILSVGITRVAASLLYEIGPHDPASIAAATVAFSAVAVLAGAVAALRTARTDPAQVLRDY
jgi:predicted permease